MLESLFHSLSRSDFEEAVLRRHLIPGLDSLPRNERHQLSNVLQGALNDTRMIRKVHDYESMDVINTLVNDLEMECARTPGSAGATAQAEYMREIVEVITEWLPDLWQVGSESVTEIQRVHGSLSFCMVTCNRISGFSSR